VAAGTAVAWSAPILTSLSSPAFAQYGPCSTCTPGACFVPGEEIRCSDDPVCFCGTEAVGGGPTGPCACIVFNGLPPEGVVPCASTSDCPQTVPTVCVNDTCLGDICQPVCTPAASSSGQNVNTR
jgi:hypothetical protein